MAWPFKKPSLTTRLLYRLGIKKPPPFPLLKVLVLIIGFTGIALGLHFLPLIQDIRDQASLNRPVTLLVEITRDHQEYRITKAAAMPANAHMPPQSRRPTHSLKIHPPSSSAHALPLHFIDTLHGESLQLKDPSTPPTDPRLPLSEKAIIAFDYTPGSTLAISSQNLPLDSTLLDTTARDHNYQALVESTQTKNPPKVNRSHTLDILFIASGYTDFDRFEQDAGAMYGRLLETPPFTDYAKNIVYHTLNNQADLGCQLFTYSLICEPFLVHQAAAESPHDTIVVIHNADNYGGAAFMGYDLAFVYRNVDQDAKEIFVHEFGHSWGHLMDEYSYGVDWKEEPDLTYNCDAREPCVKWTGVPGTSCFEQCTFNNAYRSTFNDSIMRSLNPVGGFKFGPEADLVLRRRLELQGIRPNPSLPRALDSAPDVTQDGHFDIHDLLFSVNFFNSPSNLADIDLSGQVNIQDLNRLYSKM
jgi:hypothetical protein